MGRSDQFFHGTTHAIKNGVVLPADKAGKNVSEYSFGDPGDMSEGDHAFVARNDENYAWHAANNFHANTQRRPRVYETGPAPDMKPGPWNKEHPDFLDHHEVGRSEDYPSPEAFKEVVADTVASQHQDEWASPTGFPVRKRIDIMPGRQGTFPDISWTRFSDTNTATANHPNDAQVRYGTSHGGIAGSPQFLRMLESAHEENRRREPDPTTGKTKYARTNTPLF
jgi:hypothetical protein